MLLVISLALIVLVCTLSVTNYNPDFIEPLTVENNTEKVLNVGEDLSITTFNLGFGGIDKDVHFFMDGGTMSRGISEERVLDNTANMITTLSEQESDFMLLQEVDKDSTRSYHINQYEMLQEAFPNHGYTFATNFKVMWVPIPITKPHGKVLSGISTFSKYKVDSSKRISLPIDSSWHNRVASLDRCLLETRFKVANGKELVIFNAHLSAYDKGGKVREEQLELIETLLTEEYDKGNYVIIGGDFNHILPGSDLNSFQYTESTPDWIQNIPADFNPEGYTWAYDINVPTSRTIEKEYIEGFNYLSVIDGFMVSDNIEVLKVKGTDDKFEYSDHNSVTLSFKLK